MNDFDSWRSFDYAGAAVQLWVFKHSQTTAKFRAWHVRTDERIEAMFREAATNCVANTTEELGYGPISQNNESSCLTHALESSEGLIALLNLVDQPESENTDTKLKHLKGASGYLVKFQYNEQSVYAVRRTGPSWRPKVRSSFINAVFENGELSVTPDETFSFDAKFDFYCINETVFVKQKRAYESTMSERSAYEENFKSLTADANFVALFADISPIKEYVGTNAIQLRRITVIQSKALYLQPGFSKTLRQVNDARGFGLNFDEDGKLIACANTAKTIVQILLDHRLLSEITQNIYDVPDAQQV